MKKLKFLFIALALIISFGFINVNAETGKVPASIASKEELIYYIYYYGGSAKTTGNTIKLTKSLELNVNLLFSNQEDLTIDLNGNGIYFSGTNGITIYEGTKNIKITDSSKTDNDYIRSNSGFTVSNNSKQGTLTIENTKVITNGNNPAIYSYGPTKTNIINTTVKGEKSVITAGQNSVMNIKNSKVSIENYNGQTGIKTTNGSITLTNTDVTISDSSTNGIAIKSEGANSNIIINSGNITAKENAIYNQEGNITINGGTFTSTNSAFKVEANATINDGVFTSKSMAGIQILDNANVKINKAKITTSSTGALVIPTTKTIKDYVPTTSLIDNENITTSKEINIAPLPKTKKLSATTYTYNGYTKTPTVTVTNYLGKALVKGTDYNITYQIGRKNVEKYYVQINYIGNYKTLKAEKLYFTINPKTTYISKLTKGSKSMTVKVRTYKKVNNQTFYSNWSKVKSVVIKYYIKV